MNKRIMVLGAARGQLGLIKSIKENGNTVIVASIQGDYPGISIADEFCEVDILDKEAVAKKAKEYKVDAITTCCHDIAMGALGYACDKNGLIGLSPRSAQISNDKLLMKIAFMKNGVNTAKFKEVHNKEELKNVITELSFPLIVKAIDLQGSKGIYIVENETELYSGYEKAMQDTNKDFCIVEEFIKGDEFGAQSFIVNGEILYVMPTGDITYLSNTNVPIGHYVPFDVNDELFKKIDEQVRLAIKAIGLDNCAVNVDLILKDNQVYVIELTGRVGANCLPELSSIYYGIDVYKMIYLTALGEDVVDYYESNKSKVNTPCYSMMLTSEQSGKLKRIINNNDMTNDRIVQIWFFVNEGDEIRKFKNSSDCIGQIIVKGETLESCKSFINEVIDNISFEIE